MLLADQDRSLLGRRADRRPGAGRSTGRSRCEGAAPTCCRRRSRRCRPRSTIDWAQVAALYGELAGLTGSPVVELNRAVAVAEVEVRPKRALGLVDELALDEYQYFHSTRAELLRRLGRADEARAAYERALELASSEPERRFLVQRIAALDGDPHPSHGRALRKE